MSKLNCNVVRDILPLYADSVVCVDTKELVEEHLIECESCRVELKEMREQIVIPAQVDESNTLKKFKRKWNIRQNLKGALAALLIVAIFIGVFFYIYAFGIPVKSENFVIRSGLQCVPEYDEEWNRMEVSCPTDVQTWIVDIGVYDGDVRTKSEGVWEYNNSGERVATGVKIYVYWSPFDFSWDSYKSDWEDKNGPIKYVRHGVASSEMELSPETEDFTITIICADQETTYSMKQIGLFDHVTEHSTEICPWAD